MESLHGALYFRLPSLCHLEVGLNQAVSTLRSAHMFTPLHLRTQMLRTLPLLCLMLGCLFIINPQLAVAQDPEDITTKIKCHVP